MVSQVPLLTFDVKKKGGAFGQRMDDRVWEIGACPTSLMPCKIVTFRAADALSWCVRNVDCSGGKRKLRWEVNPTELSVVSVDEAAGIGRFSISCDDAKEHGEQVVTFCPPADLMRFVSSLKSLAAVRPPANTRASRKVHPLNLSPYFRSNMKSKMDMESLMMRAALKDDKLGDHRVSDDMKIVRFR